MLYTFNIFLTKVLKILFLLFVILNRNFYHNPKSKEIFIKNLYNISYN